jgi:hypothetical protein
VAITRKCLLTFCIGMSRSVNELHVLHRSTLYKQVQLHGFFDITKGSCEDRNPPYFLGDKGYPFISWIMMLFKEDGHHNILELFNNIKLKKGWSMVEIAFNILKKISKELIHNQMWVLIFYSMFLPIFVCYIICWRLKIWSKYQTSTTHHWARSKYLAWRSTHQHSPRWDNKSIIRWREKV